ncbi:unnamed protein product [marine sediment metagenome]|uniref:DUF998 domain-containing protein n=1 Tax=marine sediment metagenome TaxID=412755 RepID=X0V9S1_9ZZZZ
MVNRIDRWAPAAGLISPPFYLALIIVLGALEPGFSHRTSLMSLLGGVGGILGLAFNLGVVVTGVCLIVFAAGLRQQLPPGWRDNAATLLLTIGGSGLIGAGAFACDQGCRNILIDPDLVGRLHIVSSLSAGMGSGVALFFYWAAMSRSEQWRSFVKPTLTAAVLANLPGVVLWFTIFADLRLRSVEGYLQRMGFIVVLLWIFFAANRMRRTSE